MKYKLAFAGLPALSLAFPHMVQDPSKDELLQRVQEREANPAYELQDRDLVSSLLLDVEGLLGSVATSIEADNKRPQPGYKFQAPNASDSRGPCPGLNLLANYGYLPRDGHVTFSEVIQATAQGFNMGVDLATVLSVFAVLTDGDLATESWYLGASPNNASGGLNRHSTIEADVSPNREDFYLACGDNHHLSSRRFAQNVAYAAQSSKKGFGLDTMTKQYSANAAFSKKYNPFLYYFPFPSIVSFAAFAFYPNFFSNGTYGSGGVANYESISSIIGAQLNKETGHFEYVPERWPENWYRRSSEYDAVAALTEGLAIYSSNPIAMPFGQLGTGNVNATTILCDLQQTVSSMVPLILSGTEEEIEAAVTWVLGKLDPYFNNTVLGCPTSAISNEIYANASREGGPLNPPPSVASNVGNNVYNSVYFTAAPTSPICSHAAAT